VAWNSKDAHACYVSKLERDHVRSAIHQITRKCREVLILREYQDMSYQEIAVVLDCPIGTVMSRLGRARAKLRALLSVNCWFTKSAERVRRERE
jgi:RNA polymerase sigma-70 factor (ECF subfamily)